jgi:hypothetical protein
VGRRASGEQFYFAAGIAYDRAEEANVVLQSVQL